MAGQLKEAKVPRKQMLGRAARTLDDLAESVDTNRESPEPLMMPVGRGLRRTYAVANLTKTFYGQDDDQDYQPLTASEGEPDDDINDVDDDLTPKRPRKAPLRDAIEASRKELGSQRAESEVRANTFWRKRRLVTV